MRVQTILATSVAVLAGFSSAQVKGITTVVSSKTSITVGTTITSPPGGPATGEPCAVVSSLVVAFGSANPNTTDLPAIPPSRALACLDAVPLDVEKSAAFIDYLRPFLQFQSTLAYLKDPPSTYILPGVDIIGGLDEIKKNVLRGAYKSQWAFEKDVNALVQIMPKDFHIVLPLPLANVFGFQRGLSLVSISTDGVSVPDIYVKADLDYYYNTSMKGSSFNWIPSPIISIDGQPVSQFLQTVSLYGNYEDPDALFNQLFPSPALTFQSGGNSFFSGYNSFGTSDISTYIFANDTSTPKVFPNIAVVNANFSKIASGSDLFSYTVLPPTTTPTPTSSATTTPPPITTVTGYPTNPVALHPEAYTAGFFLEGTTDTCVLVISSFEGKRDDAQKLMQQTIADLLSNCTHAGRTKLIIDVSANGGGSIFSGFDAFKQLFPTIEPFGGNRMRATPGVHFFIDLFSESGIYNATLNTAYQTQSCLDVNEKPFAGPEEMFGPHQFRNDNFTAELRYNFSDTIQTGIEVSGYGARSNIPPQPFKAENIILLTDGSCGSTCTIFANLLKEQGNVRSIAVGGRPQNGPMQYVAGSKGSQVYSYANIQTMINYVPSLNQSFLQQGKPFPPLPPPEYIPSLGQPPLGPPLSGQVPNFNLRNAYKAGDTTQTPTQFLYEAANCRIFYTGLDLYNVSNLWLRVAKTVWGGGTCVPGSTTNADNKISSAAKDTVPFSPRFKNTVPNPFTGPGSLGYKSNATYTAMKTAAPSSTSPAVFTGSASSVRASGVVFVAAVYVLLACI